MFGLWDTKSRNGYYVDNDGTGNETSTHTVLAKLAYSEFAKLEGQKVYSSEVAKIFIEANQSQCDYLVFMPITTTIINAEKFMAALDEFVDDTSFMVAGHLSDRPADSEVLNDMSYYHSIADGLGKLLSLKEGTGERYCAFYDHMFVIDIGLYKTHGSYNFGERTSLMSTLHRQEFSAQWEQASPDWDKNTESFVLETDSDLLLKGVSKLDPLPDELDAQLYAQTYDLPADVVGWQLANDAVNANQPIKPLPQNLRSTYYNCYYPSDDYGSSPHPTLNAKKTFRMNRPSYTVEGDLRRTDGIPLTHIDEQFCSALDGWDGYNWVRSLDDDKMVAPKAQYGAGWGEESSWDKAGAAPPLETGDATKWRVSTDQLEWFNTVRHYAQYKENWGVGSLLPAYNLQTLATKLDSIEYADIASVSALNEVTNLEKIISVCNGLNVLRWIDELPCDANAEVWWVSASNTAMDFQRQLIREIQKDDFNSITWSYESFYTGWLNNNANVPSNRNDILEELDTTIVFEESYLTPGNLNKLALMKHKFLPFSYKPFNVFQSLPLALFSEHRDEADPTYITETFIDFNDMFISPFYQMNMMASMVGQDEFNPQRHIPEIQYQKFINFLKQHSVLQGLTIFLHAYWPPSETSVSKQMY
jgi:hypothetical protein